MMNVIYVTYFKIYNYCLLDHGLPKDLEEDVVYIKIVLTTFYVSKSYVC